jgi:L-alanine-DL-glutamate epimerase-like enolase superfamily enzyme
MKIKNISSTPLFVPYLQPYYWSQGITAGSEVLLIEIKTDKGQVGFGECLATPTAVGVKAFVDEASKHLLGESIFDRERLMAICYQSLFQFRGNCSAPRFGGQVLAGLEMALWDLQGKALDRPVYDLLGGVKRKHVEYFGFIQGSKPEDLAKDAVALVKQGHRVIYCKVGRGDALDLEIVRQVRKAIGPDIRLRLDPNEAWDPLTAIRMIDELKRYKPEMIEQPCDHRSLTALKQIKDASPIAIAADQCVFNAADVYQVTQMQAADLITLGLHETGGLGPLVKAAAVAEAAGVNICLHGLYETGITTCAAHQAGLAIPNLDDANQYMNHLLTSDIIASPDLSLKDAKLGVFELPGLGFEIDPDAVAKAAERHIQHTTTAS